MSPTYLFAFTVILLLWLLTSVAFWVFWRRQRLSCRDELSRSDIFMGLASEKIAEARQAFQNLREVSDVLQIGLVELDRGELKELNRFATQLVTRLGDGKNELNTLLRKLEVDDGANTFESSGRVLLLRNVRSEGAKKLILIQDVTRSFRIAQKLKESERLALLGQMSAQIAHQLKTPLAILAGRAQMLARRLGEYPEIREHAVEIFEEARGLAFQVNEIVEFYKEKKINKEEVILLPLLKGMKNRLAAINSEIAIMIECKEDITIQTDPSILKNILFLIGQNSLKPEIGAKMLRIGARLHNGVVAISIRDDGSGLDDHVKGRLFEPFVSSDGEGLGLGLFLARDLARQIGGTLEYQDVAKGSCFVMTIPVS